MAGRRKQRLDQNRIALMIPTLAGGGAEHTYLNLAEGFQNAGYQVDLILARATGDYLSQIPPGIALVDLKASRMAKTLPGLIHYLQSRRPHVLMAGLELTHMMALMAQMASGVPTKVIVTIHSVISQNEHFYLPTRSMERQLMKLLYPRAGEIVGVSKGAAQDFSNFLGFPLSRMRVIYNPIITPGLLEKVQQPIQHAWFEEGQPPVILSAGRLHPVKDFPMLIKAFALVRQCVSLHLLILGEGKQREELESLVRQMGLQEDVCLPGFQQNPYPFMRRAAVLALSSRHEALPRVMIEAMACDCAVIATDCPGGVAELVDNGKYGHLVPVGDAEAMAQAILDVLGGDVRKPPPDWLHQFELDQVIQNYLQLI
jgi:glycosyltransferase involved in cell wall biosynthesis